MARAIAKSPVSWFLILLSIDALFAASMAALALGLVSGVPGIALVWVGLAALAFMAATIAYYQRFIGRPLRKFTELQCQLIDEEARPLIFSITELANGNLSARNFHRSIKGICPGAFETAQLPALYDSLSDLLAEGALDYNAITSASCNRLCYVGADSFREGKKCAEVMDRILGGRGEIVVMLGRLSVTSHSLRFKGFQIGLAEMKDGCSIREVVEEGEDQEVVARKTAEIIKKYPGLRGIYICEGTSPPTVAQVLNEHGLRGRITIVCHDLAEETMKAIIAGDIAATLFQNPFTQGYDPIIHLYNYLATHIRPTITRKLTSIRVVDSENYRLFWDPKRGAIVTQEELASLALPVERKGAETIRIAVILPDDSTFWKPVAEGARAAANSLACLRTEVECIIPHAFRQRDWSVAAFKPVINSLINQGFQAISLPVFDRELVDFLNEKIDLGLVVAIYNSEPTNFRGMVQAVSRRSHQLYDSEGDLNAEST
jgi:ABC-type sugar transport system substrate-binding protein